MNIKEKWLKLRDFQFICNDIPTARLQRLFAVACCQNIRHFITDKRSLKAIEIAELYADNLATHEELIIARNDAYTYFVSVLTTVCTNDFGPPDNSNSFHKY